MATYYKNDYQFRKTLSDFANKNPLGKALKPFLKDAYKFVNSFLPYPRDFLIKRIPDGAVCCEVGVYMGDFAERMFALSNPGKLYLVDPWAAIPGSTNPKYSQAAEDERYASVVKRLSKELGSDRAVIVRKTSDEAASQFAEGMFDFIYIDGDHSYAQVKKDLQNYYPKAKKGGLVTGDDYQIDEVKRAVDEFAQENNLTFEVIARQFIFIK